ncbi:hypothetical protein PV08_05070 [Exophiala spinifera]|uniref:Uncharacterized protein n=1 Tax=Exophiala spinifera TaxID=91928 RepID=A0A0D2BGX7_9EURO|nr:uncharacterized protein PV08_05070 [Exophiala spinifera]KIW17875.1 hypothetical protein PV08_05070 [Exophiala spinifera]
MDDEEITAGTGAKVPEVDIEIPTEQTKEESDAFSSAEMMIAQPYVQKVVCFFMLVAVALYFARRHQSQKSYLDSGKSDEKSMV